MPSDAGSTKSAESVIDAGARDGRLLTVDRISKHYGGVNAVNRASFEVAQGTITGVIGPNGAGKSSVLALIAGTHPVTSGAIWFAGRDISRLPSFKRARLGITRTFQLASVFGHMTVLENLVLGFGPQAGEGLWRAVSSKRKWKKREAQLAELGRGVLARFGLEGLEDVYAEELSGGQRRIVEILRALTGQPKLLLLDEPMAGIHPSMRRHIEDLLLEVRSMGTTMMVVEHELDVLERIADSVIVMAQGSVLAQGTMMEVRRNADVSRAYLVG